MAEKWCLRKRGGWLQCWAGTWSSLTPIRSLRCFLNPVVTSARCLLMLWNGISHGKFLFTKQLPETARALEGRQVQPDPFWIPSLTKPRDVAKHTPLDFHVGISFSSEICSMFAIFKTESFSCMIFFFFPPVGVDLLANRLLLIPTVRTFCRSAGLVGCAFQTLT